MNATLLTATVTVGTKEVPLTKAIIQQVPFAEGEFMDNQRFALNTGDCVALGEVQIDTGRNEAYHYYVLANTPRGLRKFDGSMKGAFNTQLHSEGRPQLERIILLK